MTAEANRLLEDLEWVGGHPALDFVNTVNMWRGDTPGEEYLHGYAELLDWHRMAGLVDEEDTVLLGRNSSRAQASAHRRALELRFALHELFRALAEDREPPQAALDELNGALRDTARWRRLEADGDGVTSRWQFDGAPPFALLGPLAWQAAGLLEHGPRDRIKECPGEGDCGWVFLDTSKNRSRTWCSMKTCGNHAKVKRFRERQR